MSYHPETTERCYACDAPIRRRLPCSAVTSDRQSVYVGTDCFAKIVAAGEAGYQPPKGGPRLYGDLTLLPAVETVTPFTGFKTRITVVRRDVYGKQKIYPSCDKAKMIAAIAGTTTLTSRVIELARDLGFEVVEEYGRSIWPEV